MKKPRLALVTIVKNEAELLPKMIESVRSVVDEIVIADTGSTDRTIQVAKGFGASVIEVPWNGDFSEARNQALSAATADFILHMDADEFLTAEDASKFKDLPFDATDVFTLALYESTGEFLSIYSRLFRRLPGLVYTGRVHESLTTGPQHRVNFTDIKIIHTGYSGTEIERKQKETRNRELLERSLSEEPNNYFINFLAAREYDRSGDSRAAELYDKALRLGEGKLGPDFYKLYATLLARLSNYERALKIIEKGIRQFALYPDLHFLKGLVLLDKNDFKPSMDAFNRCLDLVERSGNSTGLDVGALWRSIGLAAQGFGALDVALQAFKYALSIDPEDRIAREKLSELIIS